MALFGGTVGQILSTLDVFAQAVLNSFTAFSITAPAVGDSL